MQNVNILIETDELVTGPDATKELRLYFTTVSRFTIKGKIFSLPVHGVDYLHTNEVQGNH